MTVARLGDVEYSGLARIFANEVPKKLTIMFILSWTRLKTISNLNNSEERKLELV